MNRIIKFRAWDTQLKIFSCSGYGAKTFTSFVKRTNCPRYKIMQYTGLKDKNDVEICEDDIVKVNRLDSFSSWNKAIVMYSDIHASFLLQYTKEAGGILVDRSRIKSKDRKTIFGHTYEWELEIIGNIHENKELMENNNAERHEK